VLALRPAATLAATGAGLLLKPALATACGLALGLAGPALLVPVLACGLPTASSSYVLARLLGGDAELMAALITTTTLGALVTMPLVLAAARALG
jgi:malonate transporter